MSDMEFEGQREGEKVELIFRRHILTAGRGLIFCLIMVGLAILPLSVWPGRSEIWLVALGILLVGLIGMGYSYILWYFSFYLVTNERIRQTEQKGLFKKTVVDLNLDKIQSIAYNVPGMWAGIFNYGTILIQTGVGDLRISVVGDPEKVYNQLQNLVGK